MSSSNFKTWNCNFKIACLFVYKINSFAALLKTQSQTTVDMRQYQMLETKFFLPKFKIYFLHHL